MSAEVLHATPPQDTAAPSDIAGLDNLELNPVQSTPPLRRVWGKTWPKLLALVLLIAAWQLLVATHWRPTYVLPGPRAVADQLGADLRTSAFWQALATTMRRALEGFVLALVIGCVVGALVSRVPVLRAAIGSAITGLQTMPSIAWLPLAMLIYGVTDKAIIFVIVIGAAPSIANGLIAGVDLTPQLLVRAGRSMGASGLTLFRHVFLPSALPTFVGGLKQGWAFAWRALIAGELYVAVGHTTSLGVRLSNAQNFTQPAEELSMMVVIFVLGILMDVLFTSADRAVRRRHGLLAVES